MQNESETGASQSPQEVKMIEILEADICHMKDAGVAWSNKKGVAATQLQS